MKKIIFFIICLIVIMCICGCNRKASDAGINESSGSTVLYETEQSAEATKDTTSESKDKSTDNTTGLYPPGESGVEPEGQEAEQDIKQSGNAAAADSGNDEQQEYTYSDGTPNLDISSWTGNNTGEKHDTADIVEPVVDNDSISEELDIVQDSDDDRPGREQETQEKDTAKTGKEQETQEIETINSEKEQKSSESETITDGSVKEYQFPIAP